MRKILFIALGLVMVTGCKSAEIKKPICEAAKIVAAPVADLVASESVLNCENPKALYDWAVDQLVAVKMCEMAPADPDQPRAMIKTNGIIGGIVCPSLAGKLSDEGLKLLPKDAGCKGGALVGGAKDKFILACIKAIQI